MRTIVTAALQRQYWQSELTFWITLVHSRESTYRIHTTKSKEHEGLSYRTMSVQSKGVNEDEAESFKTDMLGSLLSEYILIYFFNAYKHGLHFNSHSAKILSCGVITNISIQLRNW
jgi:type III secretory pathway component EscR